MNSGREEDPPWTSRRPGADRARPTTSTSTPTWPGWPARSTRAVSRCLRSRTSRVLRSRSAWGDACDLDAALLMAMCGPDGLGGEALSPVLAAAFAQDAPADALRPGPVLAALTAQAVNGTDPLTDNELIGVIQAARRQRALADYEETVAIATFAGRRAAALAAATASGRPVGCRSGEFPGEELAAELVVSPVAASVRIDEATELVGRLPDTLAGMAAGRIDLARASVIADRTPATRPRAGRPRRPGSGGRRSRSAGRATRPQGRCPRAQARAGSSGGTQGTGPPRGSARGNPPRGLG